MFFILFIVLALICVPVKGKEKKITVSWQQNCKYELIDSKLNEHVKVVVFSTAMSHVQTILFYHVV